MHCVIVFHCLQVPDAVRHESIAISKVGVVPEALLAVATMLIEETFLVTNSLMVPVVLVFCDVASIKVRQFCKGSACAKVENANSASDRNFFILPVLTFALKILANPFRNNDKTPVVVKFCATIYYLFFVCQSEHFQQFENLPSSLFVALVVDSLLQSFVVARPD